MSTSVGSTMEGRRSQSYETIVDDPSANRAYHRSDSSFHSRATVYEAGPGREQVIQFHGILKAAIKRTHKDHASTEYVDGMKDALGLYEGYFGYFGEK